MRPQLWVRMAFVAVMPAGLLAAQSATSAEPGAPVERASVPSETRHIPAEDPLSEPAAPQLSGQKRGDIFMARKQYREAIDAYREDYLEAWKKLPVLYNKIGIAYHQMNELGLAMEHYRNALRFNPEYSEAINNIGTVYYAMGKYKDAEKQYRNALKVNPSSASVYSNLGTALFARKRYEDAIEAYQKALSLDPEIFEQRGSGGSMLQERSVEDRAKFHFYLAKVYAKQGQVDRALQYMRRCLEEGFDERKRFVEDPEFASLQDNPEFQKLLVYQPRVL